MKKLSLLTLLAMIAMLALAPAAFAQDDLDCDDFATRAEAQATYDADTSDPNGLDRDEDGQSCEDSGLPPGETATEPTTGPTEQTMMDSGGDLPVPSSQYSAPTATAADTALPDTGGASLALLGAGALLLAGGLMLRR